MKPTKILRRLLDRRAAVLTVLTLTSLGLGAQRAIAAPHACDLLPASEITRLMGDVSEQMRHPEAERDGVRISSCVYYNSRTNTGNSGILSVTTTASTAAAEERMKSYGDALRKAGGTVEPDTVAGLPALFTASKGGTTQMYVVKGNILLGAGVAARASGGNHPLRDLSRELAAVALGRL